MGFTFDSHIRLKFYKINIAIYNNIAIYDFGYVDCCIGGIPCLQKSSYLKNNDYAIANARQTTHEGLVTLKVRRERAATVFVEGVLLW